MSENAHGGGIPFIVYAAETPQYPAGMFSLLGRQSTSALINGSTIVVSGGYMRNIEETTAGAAEATLIGSIY